MLVNLAIMLLGIWGLYAVWTQRKKAGSHLWLDLASPTTHPWAYRFAIGVRLLIFGLCAVVGAYRLIFQITT